MSLILEFKILSITNCVWHLPKTKNSVWSNSEYNQPKPEYVTNRVRDSTKRVTKHDEAETETQQKGHNLFSLQITKDFAPNSSTIEATKTTLF